MQLQYFTNKHAQNEHEKTTMTTQNEHYNKIIRSITQTKLALYSNTVTDWQQVYVIQHVHVIHYQLSSFIIIINYARLSYPVAELDEYSRGMIHPKLQDTSQSPPTAIGGDCGVSWCPESWHTKIWPRPTWSRKCLVIIVLAWLQWLKWGGQGAEPPPAPVWAPPLLLMKKCYFVHKMC